MMDRFMEQAMRGDARGRYVPTRSSVGLACRLSSKGAVASRYVAAKQWEPSAHDHDGDSGKGAVGVKTRR